MSRIYAPKIRASPDILPPSIAYVECHSHENATTLKNWFDNK